MTLLRVRSLREGVILAGTQRRFTYVEQFPPRSCCTTMVCQEEDRPTVGSAYSPLGPLSTRSVNAAVCSLRIAPFQSLHHLIVRCNPSL
jgi:hypothetical protein